MWLSWQYYCDQVISIHRYLHWYSGEHRRQDSDGTYSETDWEHCGREYITETITYI